MDMDVIQTTGGVLHPQDIAFITNCICDVFNCRPMQITELQPLQKGLSNSVLSFKYNGGKYVFRYPGLGSEVLIDRGRESIIQKQIEDAGVDTSLVAMSVRYGWRISHFVETRTFNYHDINDMVRGIIQLRKLHAVRPKVRWELDHKPEKCQIIVQLLHRFFILNFNNIHEDCFALNRFLYMRKIFLQKKCF